MSTVWRKDSRGLVLSFFLILILISLATPIVSALKITEVELNPDDGCRDCKEWLEIYSEEKVDLEGWRIKDKDKNSMNLTGELEGFKAIKSSISLNNQEEKLYLYKNGQLIQETDTISDSENNDKSWQLCGEWKFQENTRGKACVRDEGKSEEDSVNQTEKEGQGSSKEKPYENNSGRVGKIEGKDAGQSEKVVNLDEAKDIKSEETKVYKSKTYLVKEYAIYGFALLCVFIIIWLLNQKY